MPDIDESKNKADNLATGNQSAIFSHEAIAALQEFGAVLQRIHNRLVAEGKLIEVDSHYAKRNSE